MGDSGPASAEALPAGTRFGSFTVVAPLAAGGMAEVYLAARRDGRSIELAAIKRMLPHLCWDPDFVRMFLEEVQIAAALSHPNIVRVFDCGVGEGGHYLAMEYLHGCTLRDLLRRVGRTGPLPLAFGLSVAFDVAQGLQHAHGYRSPAGGLVEVVHRDVCPSNVIVTFQGEVKLVDFGIARVTERTQHTRAGTLKGKIGYMSPEQCRGDAIDRRTDVFGLGILLYELTVGRKLFYGENDFAVINRIVQGQWVRPRERLPWYPAELSRVIERALAVDPDGRHHSAAELADEIASLARAWGLQLGPATHTEVLAQRYGTRAEPRVDPAIFRKHPWQARSGWRTVGVAAGTGLALGMAGFLVGGWVRADQAASRPAMETRSAPGLAEPAAEPMFDPPAEHGVADDPAPVVMVEDAEPRPVVAPSSEPASHASERKPTKRSSSRRRRGARRSAKAAPESDASADGLLPPSWRADD